LGIVFHYVADGAAQAGAVVVGDQPAQVAVGEDAGDFFFFIDQDDRAAAAFDVADFMEDLAHGESVGGDGEIFAAAEGHRFTNFDELAAKLAGGVEEGEVLGCKVSSFHHRQCESVTQREHGGGGGAGG